MKIPFFEVINTESLQNHYETDIDFEERKLNLDLNFENASINAERLASAILVLEDLKKWAGQTKEFIDQQFQAATNIDDYLAFHIEELSDEDLEKLLKDADPTKGQSEQLLSVLKLERIGFYPESERSYAVFDFVTDRELSDELLVVNINQNLELDQITWES